MPWHMERRGDKVVVVKDSDGKVVGTHSDRRKAIAQLRALYASETISKARFASRSEAGRYAAEIRWQGHIKDDVQRSIVDRVREFSGLTVKILSGEAPATGFVVAMREHSRIIREQDFFDPAKGKAILAQYLKDKRDMLVGQQFLGLWHDKKNGEVVLDVVDNIQDRDDAIRIGQERNQQSIWDVVNEEEIDTGGTGDRETIGTQSGETTKAVERDDGRGNRDVRREGLRRIFEVYGSEVLKGRFASRSEAGRYAANIRWQNNQKEEDDPKKRAEALRVRGAKLADRWQEIQDNISVNPIKDIDEYEASGDGPPYRKGYLTVPLLDADGVVIGKQEAGVSPKAEMDLHEDIIAFGADLRAEAMRRLGITSVEELETEIKTIREELYNEYQRLLKVQDQYYAAFQIINGFKATYEDSTLAKGEALADEMLMQLTPAELELRSGMQDALKVWQAEPNNVDKRRAFDRLESQFNDVLKTKFGYNKLGYREVIREDLKSIIDELQETKSAPARLAETVQELIKEILPVGNEEVYLLSNSKTAKGLSNTIKKWIPDAIIEVVNKRLIPTRGLKVTKSQGGGHWQPSANKIQTDGSEGTNIHEAMHMIASSDPFFNRAEKLILERRKAGTSADSRSSTRFVDRLRVGVQQSVGQITDGGFTYGKGYNYFPDNFYRQYAGKVYVDGSRETLTTGMELVTGTVRTYTNDSASAGTDWDHYDSTLGLLIVGGLRLQNAN